MKKAFVIIIATLGFSFHCMCQEKYVISAATALKGNNLDEAKEDIDKAMKLGSNVPMGPLTLCDFVGLDTCLAVLNVLHKEFGDSKYRPCPLLTNYVNAGWYGKKTGRGFYTYK